MSNSEKYDVIVVGAGAAGLHAACLLQEQHGKKVLVLEAKDRVGGRLFAKKIRGATGLAMRDLGGQWVGNTQHHLLKLISDLRLEKIPQYIQGERRLIIGDESNVKSWPDGGHPPLGTLQLLEIAKLIEQIEEMAASIDLENLSSHPKGLEWDSMTLHSFVINSCNENARQMFEAMNRAILGIDLAQVSLLQFLHYCKQAGSFDHLIQSKGDGAQAFKVKGSMYQICEKMSEQLHHLVLSAPVFAVDQTGAAVQVSTKDGKTYLCTEVIIAIPPHLQSDIAFSPPLPNDRIKAGDGMPGHYIKFVAMYAKPFWRTKGLSGESIRLTLPCATGPVTTTFDGTEGGNPAIVGFICGEHGMYWTQKTMEERKRAVLSQLAASFGKEALNPIEYIDKDWSQEPYNGGCPVDILKPRALLYYHHALTQPFGRIHWAGTETARVWRGYIDGALESGLRAATEVLNGKSDTGIEWNESEVFANHKKYISYIEERRKGWILTALKTAVGAALIGGVGYCAWKHLK